MNHCHDLKENHPVEKYCRVRRQGVLVFWFGVSEKTSKKELLSLSSCYTHALTLDAIFSALSCLKEIIESSYEKESIYTGPSGPWGRRLSPVSFSMKRLGVFLLPSGWDASPSQGYPQLICWYPFIHLGEEKYCESKVSCLRTQQNDPGQGSSPDHSIRSRAH